MDNQLILSQFSFRVGKTSWGPWNVKLNANVIGLVGPNGAGKSSLFRALLGDSLEVQGKAEIAGEFLPSFGRRDLVGTVPQDSPFPADWTVEATLSLGFPGASKDKERKELGLEIFGLGELRGKRLGELSSGQRQRSFLCRAYLQKPKILLLDEPTNHLDPLMKESFWRLIGELKGMEAAPLIVISTHDLSYLKKQADGILALGANRELLYSGASESFWASGELTRVFGKEISV